MDRKKFIQSLALLPLIGCKMKLQSLEKMTASMDASAKMPVLFLGHGSPMNAIEENEFVAGFRKVGKSIKNQMRYSASQPIGKQKAPMSLP